MPMLNNDQGFVAIQKRMLKKRGLDLSQYKEKCLKRRIDVRLRETGAQTYLEYSAVLKRDPSECDRFLDDLTINVTQFFRDTETFKAIKDDVIPKIISGKKNRTKKLSGYGAQDVDSSKETWVPFKGRIRTLIQSKEKPSHGNEIRRDSSEVTASKDLHSPYGNEIISCAVKQILKNVVREICTLRS